MMIGNYIGIGRRSGVSLQTYWSQQPEVLFFGEISKIRDGKLYNQKSGATDYLTVAGVAGSETYQAPNTAPYQTADTDYIWFKTDVSQRTTTTAELIGYDFTRTIVKYADTAPYAIESILILSSDVDTNKMRDDFDLSIWWSNVLSFHGSDKDNRGIGKSTWVPEVFNPITANLLREYYSDVDVTVTGSGISQINDGSVNDAHAVQADDSKRPPLLANQVNGLPVIKGDGSADFLSFLSTGNLTNFTLFTVVAPLASNEMVAGRSDSANDYIQLLASSQIRISMGASLATFATGSLSGYHIYEIKRDFTGLKPVNCFIDGVASASNPVNVAPNFTLNQLLAYSTTIFGKAGLAAFIIYSDCKSAPDSGSILNFLKSKYAIA